MNHTFLTARNVMLCFTLILALVAGTVVIAEPAPNKAEKPAPEQTEKQDQDNRYKGDGSRIRAFPGAEGFGGYSKGGRGGKVIYVTNLNDSGPGSFRAACNTKGPRIVIFRVGGIIALKSELKVVEPFMTIAGQTAPGDGICLKGDRFKIDAHDIVVRYLRSRLGDETQKEQDSIATYTNGYDVILDHCSTSWSIDETLSTTHARNVTVQWCIISESLNNSFHKKGKHGYGSLIWGAPITFHHNLYAHHSDRVPRPGTSNNQPYPTLLDFRNNVLYDFGAGGYCHGENMQVNYIGNYIKPSGKARGETVFRVRKLKGSSGMSRIHFANNLHLGSPEATKDNNLLLKVHPTSGTVKDVLVEKPFPIPDWAAVKTDSPEKSLRTYPG